MHNVGMASTVRESTQSDGLITDQQSNLDGLVELYNRITKFRNKLYGQQLQDVKPSNANTPVPVPNGVYDRMVDIKNHTSKALSNAHELMSDLERFA